MRHGKHVHLSHLTECEHLPGETREIAAEVQKADVPANATNLRTVTGTFRDAFHRDGWHHGPTKGAQVLGVAELQTAGKETANHRR